MAPNLVTSLALIGIGLSGVAALGLLIFRNHRNRAKSIERGLKMVPIHIQLPPASDDTEGGSRDEREVMREKIAQAESLYTLLSGTAKSGLKNGFYGQRHLALEIIASNGLIHFYAAVPISLVSVAKQAIIAAYPGARLEEVEDHNLFNPQGKLETTVGAEVHLKKDAAYPIAVYQKQVKDPLGAMLNILSSLQPGEGAGLQMVIRPASSGWTKKSKKIAKNLRSKHPELMPLDILTAPVKPPEISQEAKQLSALEQETIDAVEEKTKQPGFETMIRLIVSAGENERAKVILRDMTSALALFEAPGLNGLKATSSKTTSTKFVADFILRVFPIGGNTDILSTSELATIFHLPEAQFTSTNKAERQMTKQVDGPPTIPQEGLLLGFNDFRGSRKEIRLSPDDRRRHVYIIGQTGTGKSTLLEHLAVQDIAEGRGLAFVDPHGDVAEMLLGYIPKERMQDVIYFNPGDTDRPVGLNIFEFNSPDQKDFLIQESIEMLYKIYDPNKTGIIGPRFEQWYRNAALTLMSDPAGATFIEIPKLFSDDEFLKKKIQYVTDPTVMDFWTKEMAQTSDYHKSEMLGYFVSKFGAFLQNDIMRSIMGQVKSSFNFRDVMDNRKILIVNLSKGRLGDTNANLLGMIMVIKFQAAAMSRANIPEAERADFSLFVDEFQNFSTDSFSSILSEARKYHLNLLVANQYISQLKESIRDAVFGNVGTTISLRCSLDDAEYLQKQFSPTFVASDLVGLSNGTAVLRLMIKGQPSLPFSLSIPAPLKPADQELVQTIKDFSAANHGKNKAEVDAEIYRRIGLTIEASPAGTNTTQPAPTPVFEPAPKVEAPLPARPASPSVMLTKPADPILNYAANPTPHVPTPLTPAALPNTQAPVAAVAAAPAQSNTVDSLKGSLNTAISLKPLPTPLPPVGQLSPKEAGQSAQSNTMLEDAQIPAPLQSTQPTIATQEPSSHLEIKPRIRSHETPAEPEKTEEDLSTPKPVEEVKDVASQENPIDRLKPGEVYVDAVTGRVFQG